MIFLKKFVCLILFFTCMMAEAQQHTRRVVPVIFDSDMGPDYDDAGAIALLHALADSGYAKVLATIASTNYEGVAGVLNVFNTYFNRPGVPVGVPKGKAVSLRDSQHWTDTLLDRYPHLIKTNARARDATALYRRILAAEPRRSVTIVNVGFLTNLAELYNSPADQYSPLNGRDLIREKVKELVCMAGKFPSGKEFNVEKDAAASKIVFDNWNTPIIFSGFEIGQKIKAGLPLVQNKAIQNSPVKDVFRISIPKSAQDSAGRMSWDQTAVLIAIKGYKPWYRLQEGRIEVEATGSNTWNNSGKGHFYLVEDRPFQEVQQLINLLMMHQPVATRNAK
ncbi:MAG: nucleoside hydrolase [Chitinophagaceae bacterium]